MICNWLHIHIMILHAEHPSLPTCSPAASHSFNSCILLRAASIDQDALSLSRYSETTARMRSTLFTAMLLGLVLLASACGNSQGEPALLMLPPPPHTHTHAHH
jgi:hypothetical protein